MVNISVIIPTYNEAKCIQETLIALKRQKFHSFEIIVKDGESTDETVEAAEKYADNVISIEDVSVADARNQGVKIAKGDLLVFVDADTVLPSNALQRISELMRNKKIVGGSCRKTLRSENVLDKLIYELVNLSTYICSRLRIGGAHGNCMFIRKSTFIKTGGFNPRIQIAEEQDLVRKAMKFGKFVFLLDLYVTENPRRILKWGKIKLYITWFIGMLTSFRVQKKQKYEKVR
jgi:glycosyltransferase involved in cell wall biosynthesis